MTQIENYISSKFGKFIIGNISILQVENLINLSLFKLELVKSPKKLS
jgi:hypothetical protein